VQFFSSENFFLNKIFIQEAKLANFYCMCDKGCDKPVFLVQFIYGMLPCHVLPTLMTCHLLTTKAAIIFHTTALLQANSSLSPMLTPNQHEASARSHSEAQQ